MTLFTIQEVIEGCAEEPTIFEDEKQANDFYIKLVNEVEHKEFDTIEKTISFMNKNDNPDHDILYWELDTQDICFQDPAMQSLFIDIWHTPDTTKEEAIKETVRRFKEYDEGE